MNNGLNRDMLLYTTEKCNMDCSYCYNDINENKAKMSDINSYNNLKGFIDYLIDKNHIDKIMLTGGEPFLWDKLDDFIDEYRGKKDITIFTNGTKLRNKIDLISSGVEIKLALHGLVGDSAKTGYYKKIIRLLEEKNIKYGLIYLISKKNFHRFHEDYVKLREASNSSNFSLKYQPVIIPESNTKFIRGNIPIKVIPNNIKTYEEHSLNGLSESEWEIFRQNILGVIDYENEYRRIHNIKKDVGVYEVGNKSLEYHEMLKQFYLNGIGVTSCDTGPIIVLGSDGYLYQCMFLFNSSIGNIHDALTEKCKEDILNILANKNLDEIKCASCFSEECLGALRPV